MTRLRLSLADPNAIDEPRLRQLGAKGIVRPGGDAVQVVLGPVADQVAGEIRASLHGKPQVANDAWFKALGGADNVEDLRLRSTRLILLLTDPQRIDESALKQLGARAVTRSDGGRVHVLLDGASAERVAAALA
jgi:PTS system N-acetylglucosamine-specific IIC component